MHKQIDAFRALDAAGERRTIVHFADVPEFVDARSEPKDWGYKLDDDTPLEKLDEQTFVAPADGRKFRVLVEDEQLAR